MSQLMKQHEQKKKKSHKTNNKYRVQKLQDFVVSRPNQIWNDHAVNIYNNQTETDTMQAEMGAPRVVDEE